MKSSINTSFIILSISLSFLFVSCNGSPKWWGNRQVDKIEHDNGYIERFSYNENDELVHYYHGPTEIDENDTLNYNPVLYNVSIQYYQDSAVVIKGIMPSKTYSEDGYSVTKRQEGIATYTIGKDGLASSCYTTYPNDTSEYPLTERTYFGYKRYQLTSVNGENIYRKDDNIDYKVPDSPNDFVFVTTFIYYMDEENKSNLILITDSRIPHHEPAFYARILGKPVKHLPSQHVLGGSVSYNYFYTFDPEGYVMDVTETRSSNVRLGFMGDPLYRNNVAKITYREKE